MRNILIILSLLLLTPPLYSQSKKTGVLYLDCKQDNVIRAQGFFRRPSVYQPCYSVHISNA